MDSAGVTNQITNVTWVKNAIRMLFNTRGGKNMTDN